MLQEKAHSEIWRRRRPETVDSEIMRVRRRHNLFHELPLNYSPNMHKETMRTLLRRGVTLYAIGECAKRLLAHSPTALSELKPCISQELIIQNEKKFLFFLSRLYGMD